MEWPYRDEELVRHDYNLLICNEGNFQYGNASISLFNTNNGNVEQEVFNKANGMRLGDVCQSATYAYGKLWLVVNNSHVIFCVDPKTFQEIGRIEDLVSPRYIHFLSEEKAYVTNLWSEYIDIVNPKTFQKIGAIKVPGQVASSGSTEQMVQIGTKVYVNCWSYQNSVISIDTNTDEVVESVEVGIQPTSLCKDKDNNLWTVTDGGYEGSLYGHTSPSLVKVGVEPLRVLWSKSLSGENGWGASEIQTNEARDTIFFIHDAIKRMSIHDTIPEVVIPYDNTIYYGLTTDPKSGDIYIADAIDYVQPGVVKRYKSNGEFVSSFRVGIIPGAFCWVYE